MKNFFKNKSVVGALLVALVIVLGSLAWYVTPTDNELTGATQYSRFRRAPVTASQQKKTPQKAFTQKRSLRSRFSFSKMRQAARQKAQQNAQNKGLSGPADCAAPYHKLKANGACVWSCNASTHPDPKSGECVCNAGLTETGTDELGRRVCGDDPGPTFECNEPYRKLMNDGRCLWSCGQGTHPDPKTKECVCNNGLTETGTDDFGRRVCTVGAETCNPITRGEFVDKLDCSVGDCSQFEDLSALPDNAINRAEVAKILSLYFGLDCPADLGAAPTCSDVEPAAWFAAYVECGIQHELFSCEADGTFNPGDTATDCWVDAAWSNAPVVKSEATLNVSLATSPASQTVIKGQVNVPATGLTFAAGNASDVVLEELTLRFVADDDGDFDDDDSGAPYELGDYPAHYVIPSVALYQGVDLVAEAQALQIGDGVPDAAEQDYYKAVFHFLNYTIPAGTEKTLTAHINLSNAIPGKRFAAVYTVAEEDVVAADMNDNPVIASGGVVNGINDDDSHDVLVTVNNSGTLSIQEADSPASKILLTGSHKNLVANYKAVGTDESFEVERLTVMLDQAGAFDIPATNVDDFDAATIDTNGVAVSYTDINGVERTVSGSLAGGVATLTLNPKMYVNHKEPGADINIYANVAGNPADADTLSGKKFRLGIQDTGNTPATFQAVGVASANTFDTPNIDMLDSANVNPFTIRRSKPVVTVEPGISEFLSAGGTQDVFKFKIKAEGAAVGLGRVVLNVEADGLTSTTGVSNAQVIRNGSLLTAGTYVTLYWDVGAVSCTAHDNDYNCGAGTATESDLIISFPVTETLAAGQSNTYLVQTDLNGVDTVGDWISVKFDTGDENTAVSGGAVAGKTASTKYVYANAVENGLFNTAADFGQESNAGTNRNFVWSDKSDDNFKHPTVDGATGVVTVNTGSPDWTNGYLLNLPNTAVSRIK